MLDYIAEYRKEFDMIKTIIFDLDNVLIESKEIHFKRLMKLAFLIIAYHTKNIYLHMLTYLQNKN